MTAIFQIGSPAQASRNGGVCPSKLPASAKATMIDRALAIAGIAVSIASLVLPTLFPAINRKIAWGGLAFGILLLGAAGGIAFFADGETPPTTQNNYGSGPLLNVPGKENTFNVYPPQSPPLDSGVIIQAGASVGKAFGARRSPTDATIFEFAEITNCGQFNTGAPFIFNGVRLQFISEQNSALVLATRPQDSPIRFGVRAKVLE